MDSANAGNLSRLYGVFEKLGDREPTTLEEAQAVIENISAEKGHLDKDTLRGLESLPPRSRERLLRIVELKAKYTTSISEDLYSSKYPFLNELVQNADDSSYRTAQRNLVSPYLRFIISPEAFVVETNEDGFLEDEHDHIGEKGFGFKSVFSIAEKVHIQSGLWSFQFKHRRGQDGLGMVTPLDTPMDTLGEDVTTRITMSLSLHDSAGYQKLLNGVEDMPMNTILFLKNIRTLRFVVEKVDGRIATTAIQKTGQRWRNTLRITWEREWAGSIQSEEGAYRFAIQTVCDMPEDARREGRNSAQVELAFPVHPRTQQPQLDELGQHMFAHLPIRRIQSLPFMIQADFIAVANREDIRVCEWNDKLTAGIDTLAQAVAGFDLDEELYVASDYAVSHRRALEYSGVVDLLDRAASRNPRRKAFYAALGVEECPIELVVEKIREAHRSSIWQPSTEVLQLAEFRYLYYYCENYKTLKPWIKIPALGKKTTPAAASENWYFPSQKKHDMYSLIPTENVGDVRELALFIPQALIDQVSLDIRIRGITWREWLKRLTGAHCSPRFSRPGPGSTQLSRAILAVLKYNPGMFLDALREHWSDYQNSADDVANQLKSCRVPCNWGFDFSLHLTFLDTAFIRDVLEELDLDADDFAILELPSGRLTGVTYQQWQFLELFGVRSKPDIDFYQQALELTSHKDETPLNHIKTIYRSMAQLARVEDYDNLR
ncbi:hypothetical protein EK21DRAFT_118224 [Setomelanomma holmii]|uniref:Uncharacterized protein n=1 Tax=Setomelanomma holmii TaxID=210430 RepID=A0A9P4GYE4_9PLEO|nr:hypothetical protein EK21DRAFT_118224 [Setomelanomma holmii]